MADAPLQIDIVTIFPRMLDSILGESILKRAQEAGLVQIRCVNLRDFATGAHLTTDDRPYGGGPGMVMKPEPVFKAVDALRRPESKVILMTPQGEPFKQTTAMALSKEAHLIFLCGHYEGVDHRVEEHLADELISIGDYVLTGGELGAMVISDAVARMVPGVLGDAGSAATDSFYEPILEYPQYTKPAEYNGWKVPDVLLSGHHANIARWRRKEALRRTMAYRPDLLEGQELSKEDRKLMAEIKEELIHS